MATLTGQLVSASYPTLLKVAAAPFDNTFKTIEDGGGGASALQVSTLGVKSTGLLQSDGAATVGGTLGVTGATTVGGTLGVTGAATLSSTLGVTGAATVGGSLTVTGTINANGQLIGNTQGLHTGNVTGNTAGVHTGSVIGNVTGNTAGVHTGSVIGNANTATTATTLATSRNFSISGAVTGTGVSFNGSSNVDIQTTITSHPRVFQTHLDTPVTTTCTVNVPAWITGFSATIIPQSIASRVRVDVTWNGYVPSSFDKLVFVITRDTPYVGMPVSYGSRTAGLAAVGGNAISPQTLHTVSFSYLDSPASIVACSYYVQLLSNTAVTVTTNSSATDTNTTAFIRTSSTIILTEIYT